jgi:hypothetical protein
MRGDYAKNRISSPEDPLAIYLIALIVETEEQRGSSSAFDRTFSNFLGLCSLVPTSEREAKNADTQQDEVRRLGHR